MAIAKLCGDWYPATDDEDGLRLDDFIAAAGLADPLPLAATVSRRSFTEDGEPRAFVSGYSDAPPALIRA